MKPPENHQSQHLEECRHLLSSLSESIPAVRSFLGRWAAVSATLGRLRPAVDEIAGFPANELSDDFLCFLSQTLALTLSISNQCRNPDPPAGRLQTQSELAAAAASLDQLAADADFLLRSGALLDPLSPPSSSSRRETLRAEAQSVIIRLQIGTVASRISALDSLMSILNGDDKNVIIAAAQGLVPALVRLLDFASLSHPEVREKAVAVIARVSSLESCRHLLASEAAFLVSHLSRVLIEPDGVGSTKEKACFALQALTIQKDIAMTVGTNGTISILLETCRSGTPPAQAAAAGVLKNLAAVLELREKLIEENAVPVFVRVLQSGTIQARENSIFCLSNLTTGEDNQTIKLTILQQGVLDCIRDYWDSPAHDNRDLRPAISLLRNLSSSSVFSEIILSSGFLPRIIRALDSSSAGTRIEAIRAVSDLTLFCTNKEGVEYAMPKIVRMLEAKGAEEKEAAVKALASMMTFSVCRRLMRKDEKGILNLILLLNSSVEKKHIVTVLLAVAQSRRCRKLMVTSGARGLLPWLESMEVEGAKKLSELLAKGKLLGVFPRN
ncbi:uncharacterized protein LOC110107440 [Dendrobium catenatum]|uniref:U-box domain-containing protein 4 n=1 Tax=Dendrobium catenatum TaxID=906689 RepID=A0A2I0WFT8_9ASPA|nr:uncharacterized protein LOC110107440 [Dendrobium catenatum]PKU74502.1 U-box domain-containing protein 4 [Dendrobium catenatum]